MGKRLGSCLGSATVSKSIRNPSLRYIKRMGRKKIEIKKIEDVRNLHSTMAKRKHGLLKKAMELSILCDCEIAVTIVSQNKKAVQFCSSTPENLQFMYNQIDPKNVEILSNEDYDRLYKDEKDEKQSTAE